MSGELDLVATRAAQLLLIDSAQPQLVTVPAIGAQLTLAITINDAPPEQDMGSQLGKLYMNDDAVVSIAVSDPTTPGFTPSAATLTVQAPDGTMSTPAVTLSGANATATISLTKSGRWFFKWLATGGGKQGALEGSLWVERAVF